MPQFKALDFDAKQEDVINCATDKRTELATKKVPYPTPPHKIFDGISNRKVKKAVTGNKLLLKDGSDDKKKSKTNSIIIYRRGRRQGARQLAARATRMRDSLPL